MIKSALIKIKDSKDKESIVFAQGSVRSENNAHYIEYETIAEKFIIGISGDIVTVTKIAEESYTLVLQENKPHNFDVQTPFGILSLALYPTEVKHEMHDKGIDVTLHYKLISTNGDLKDSQDFFMEINCIYKRNISLS